MNAIEELAACRYDIPRFANLLGVQGHPGQVRLWKAMSARNETRWRPEWLTLALSSGNRAGKTLGLGIGVFHHALFKMGLRPPAPHIDRELDAWSQLPYHWFHFGIQQETADQLYQEVVNVLEGRHPAQKGRGCPLTDALGPITVHDKKERGEYHWIRFISDLGGAEIHFRSTNEKAVGQLGKDMNGISYDECGFDANLAFVVNEVLHLRRLGTGGPLIFISTPTESYPGFFEEWAKGDPENPQREPNRLSLRMSTRDNIGYGIDQSVFDRLVEGYPEALIPQNIDGYFLEGRQAFFNRAAVDACFVEGMHDKDAVKGGHYVQGVDPAHRYDATWSIVLKVEGATGVGVRAKRRKGKQKITDVVAMVRDDHDDYSEGGSWCLTGMDTTGMGGGIVREMLADIVGLRSVEFGGTRNKKQKMLTDLKGMIEQGRLRFPREGPWLELRKQLKEYRIDPVKGDRGQHTDGVMALAIAVKMLLSRPDEAVEEQPFNFWAGAPEEVEEGYRRRIPSDIDRMLALREGVVTSRMRW